MEDLLNSLRATGDTRRSTHGNAQAVARAWSGLATNEEEFEDYLAIAREFLEDGARASWAVKIDEDEVDEAKMSSSTRTG